MSKFFICLSFLCTYKQICSENLISRKQEKKKTKTRLHFQNFIDDYKISFYKNNIQDLSSPPPTYSLRGFKNNFAHYTRTRNNKLLNNTFTLFTYLSKKC